MSDFYNHGDILQMDELVSVGRQYLETLDSSDDRDDRDEAYAALRALEEVADDLGLGGTHNQTYAQMLDKLEEYAQDEPTAIAADYFTQYAQELAEDIGAVQSDAPWPVRHIDWPAAARELQVDYNSFTLEGHEYHIRAV